MITNHNIKCITIQQQSLVCIKFGKNLKCIIWQFESRGSQAHIHQSNFKFFNFRHLPDHQIKTPPNFPLYCSQVPEDLGTYFCVSSIISIISSRQFSFLGIIPNGICVDQVDCIFNYYVYTKHAWDNVHILTVVSKVSAHGHLNISHNFGPHGHLPGLRDINCIHLYGSCYIDLLKCGRWVLTQEWDTIVHISWM